MIYLDNAATTKPLKELHTVYEEYTNTLWNNPSSLYSPSVEVSKRIEQAKQTLINAFSSPLHKCFITSGGTEGANTVILNGFRIRKDIEFVCAGAEHPCVFESFKKLEEKGYKVTYVAPDRHGYIEAQSIIDAVNDKTALVSVMHVNNETGAINDIAKISSRVKTKNKNTLFHADGVQAFLRVSNSFDYNNVDYYTVSAHKVHAHKGVGAVFYLPKSPLKPYLLGGGQENGLRSGTENILGIISFAYAADYFNKHLEKTTEHLKNLKQVFLTECLQIDGSMLISPTEEQKSCNHIVNISFEGINGETLLHMLESKGIYISTGSACSSKKGKSRLSSMLGLSNEVSAGIVRISFSYFNTQEEILCAVEEIKKNIVQLRKFKRV